MYYLKLVWYRKLSQISARCETSNCDQASCQDAVQQLYQDLMKDQQDLALKIGLCVCR